MTTTTETLTAAPLQFTSRAVTEIRRLMGEEGFNPAEKLRVGVKGGGCSGLSYVLGFDQPTEKDEYFSSGDVDFIMQPAHGIYLMGMEIDWENGLNARGFVFNNPNASKTCGCGTSFAV